MLLRLHHKSFLLLTGLLFISHLYASPADSIQLTEAKVLEIASFVKRAESQAGILEKQITYTQNKRDSQYLKGINDFREILADVYLGAEDITTDLGYITDGVDDILGIGNVDTYNYLLGALDSNTKTRAEQKVRTTVALIDSLSEYSAQADTETDDISHALATINTDLSATRAGISLTNAVLEVVRNSLEATPSDDDAEPIMLADYREEYLTYREDLREHLSVTLDLKSRLLEIDTPSLLNLSLDISIDEKKGALESVKSDIAKAKRIMLEFAETGEVYLENL